ncbi:Hypothetical protein R9X50_00775700 [Acrodontium crateriforme]|uniref:Uncharacterized protein n=1 Tax=Acrodontium crateriforme TaxID=150365 RepID=A0AAQ3RCX8_9PEZI|nr:Hypothetical protein R9X50_00775700 [Acrodontium crateriforme]
MASLETLPAPLPLLIIKFLSDLKALDSVCRASPVCRIVFEQHAAEIIESIISKSLQVDVAREFRVSVMIIAQETSEPSSREEVKTLYTRAHVPLARNTPVNAIVRTLRGFSYDHALGDLIMRDKLQTLYALPHEHLHPSHSFYHESFLDEVSGVPYRVPEPSAPHWIEEQRVARYMLQRRIVHLRQKSGVDVCVGAQRHPCEFENGVYLSGEIIEIENSETKLYAAGKINSANRHDPISWAAPAPMPDFTDALEKMLEDRDTTPQSARGWFDFYYTAAFSLGSPLHRTEDWPVLCRLGFGIWSSRRLGLELQVICLRELYEHSRFGPSGDESLPLLRPMTSNASEVFVMHRLVLAARRVESKECDNES